MLVLFCRSLPTHVRAHRNAVVACSQCLVRCVSMPGGVPDLRILDTSKPPTETLNLAAKTESITTNP